MRCLQLGSLGDDDDDGIQRPWLGRLRRRSISEYVSSQGGRDGLDDMGLLVCPGRVLLFGHFRSFFTKYLNTPF